MASSLNSVKTAEALAINYYQIMCTKNAQAALMISNKRDHGIIKIFTYLADKYNMLTNMFFTVSFFCFFFVFCYCLAEQKEKKELIQ